MVWGEIAGGYNEYAPQEPVERGDDNLDAGKEARNTSDKLPSGPREPAVYPVLCHVGEGNNVSYIVRRYR